MNLAQDYMQTHFQEAVSLEKLGAICGVSKFYLIKLFGKWTGMTPHQYLLQVRIGKAKILSDIYGVHCGGNWKSGRIFRMQSVY